jgi:hypothetical protein
MSSKEPEFKFTGGAVTPSMLCAMPVEQAALKKHPRAKIQIIRFIGPP